METKKTAWNKGLKASEETKKKISLALKGRKAWNKGLPRTWKSPSEFKKGHNIGKRNFQWKGDAVSYRNLHRWVVRHKGHAHKCEECGKEGTGRQIHWSNNDHTYLRNLRDWTQLCAKCHAQHDKLLRRLKATNSGNIQNGQS